VFVFDFRFKLRFTHALRSLVTRHSSRARFSDVDTADTTNAAPHGRLNLMSAPAALQLCTRHINVAFSFCLLLSNSSADQLFLLAF
jgi:hypothetical protein